MVSVRHFSDEFIPSQEALNQTGVDQTNDQWRKLIIPAYTAAVRQKAETFDVNVPIELLDFCHPRFVMKVSFRTQEIEIYPAREKVVGINNAAIERFATVASGGTPLKPADLLDYHMLATRFESDGRFVDHKSIKGLAQYTLLRMREALIQLAKGEITKTERLGETGPITLPDYMNFMGEVFRTSDIGEYRVRQDHSRMDDVFCVRDGVSVEKIIAAYTRRFDEKYAVPNNVPGKSERHGVTEEQALNMSGKHSMSIRRGIIHGYMKWQRDAAHCADNSLPVPENFEATIEVGRRSGRDSEQIKIIVPAGECGFYIHYRTMHLGISRAVLKDVADHLALKWRLGHNVESITPAGMINIGSVEKHILDTTDLGHADRQSFFRSVSGRVADIINKVMEHRLSNGNETESGGIIVDVAHDFACHRVSSAMKIYFSPALVDKISKAAAEDCAQGKDGGYVHWKQGVHAVPIAR